MQIVGPYGVSTVASMQENAVLDLEDLYMMVERVRVGKRVNGGQGVALCSDSSGSTFILAAGLHKSRNLTFVTVNSQCQWDAGSRGW